MVPQVPWCSTATSPRRSELQEKLDDDGYLLEDHQQKLVGGLEHEFYFPRNVGNNHPNWLIFFRGVQTTNQKTKPWWNWQNIKGYQRPHSEWIIWTCRIQHVSPQLLFCRMWMLVGNALLWPKWFPHASTIPLPCPWGTQQPQFPTEYCSDSNLIQRYTEVALSVALLPNATDEAGCSNWQQCFDTA